MSTVIQLPRTYNQSHIPRKYTPGKRRVSIYWTWSYPWEASRNVEEMDNRFSTMTEVRRVAWPAYETPEWSTQNFLQGIDGTLELFHRSTLSFQQIAGEATGHPVAVFQRVDQAGFRLPIDERILADTDTLMVFGLDHLPAEQEAAPEEIPPPRRPARTAPAALQPIHPLADEGARCPGHQSIRTSPSGREGHQGDRTAHGPPRPRQAE